MKLDKGDGAERLPASSPHHVITSSLKSRQLHVCEQRFHIRRCGGIAGAVNEAFGQMGSDELEEVVHVAAKQSALVEASPSEVGGEEV